MGIMRILDSTGDSVVEWSPEFQEEIAQAETRFNELVVAGKHMAFEIMPGGSGKKIKEFNPDAGQITLVPIIAGG